MSDSTELRRIVGAMTERPWETNGPTVNHDDGNHACPLWVAECKANRQDATAIAALANHAEALVALVEACEGVDAAYREDVPKLLEQMRKIRQAIAVVHAIKGA